VLAVERVGGVLMAFLQTLKLSEKHYI